MVGYSWIVFLWATTATPGTRPPWVNLINIQLQGLRLRLEKTSTGMHVGFRLGTAFESYKHRLEAYLRT
jgi:hypothetical protein